MDTFSVITYRCGFNPAGEDFILTDEDVDKFYLFLILGCSGKLPDSPGHWRVISTLKSRESRSMPAEICTRVQPPHSRPLTRNIT